MAGRADQDTTTELALGRYDHGSQPVLNCTVIDVQPSRCLNDLGDVTVR
jgi:hypothetical protein